MTKFNTKQLTMLDCLRVMKIAMVASSHDRVTQAIIAESYNNIRDALITDIGEDIVSTELLKDING